MCVGSGLDVESKQRNAFFLSQLVALLIQAELLLVFGAGFSAGCVPRTGSAAATAWSLSWEAFAACVGVGGGNSCVLSRACFELPLV